MALSGFCGMRSTMNHATEVAIVAFANGLIFAVGRSLLAWWNGGDGPDSGGRAKIRRILRNPFS